MGKEPTNRIEINGKIYDARSGQLVSKLAPKNNAAPVQTKAKPQHSGRSIDGIAPSKHNIASPKKPHTAAPHANAHKAQRPHTLMRRSVMKPQQAARTSFKATSPVARPSHAVAVQPKLSAKQVHPARAAVAANTPKSPAISKYSKPSFSRQAPARQATQPIKPAQSKQVTAQQTAHGAYFQKAIEQATSHEQAASGTKQAKKQGFFKRHHNIVAAAASITVFVAAGAFLAFANMSKIELKLANTRAGISASIPKYEPAGYTKDGPISYNSGKVTISFKNNSSADQTYQVSQQESALNSSTLQDEVLAGGTKPRQTVQQNGNTIYLYGDSDAAWVSGGILYTISGNADLSNNEILLIADSV